MEKGTLRQILLITDGCSNRGESPVQCAKRAYENGITVNVIGILDESESYVNHSLQEVELIAEAGGGVSQVIYKEDLSRTVQAVTRQAMNETLQGFVHKELANIFGTERSLEEIEPDKRGEVIEVVEKLGETCNLEVLLLIDTSASMHDKLPTVKDALFDLSLNLEARLGDNLFAIYQYPTEHGTIGLIQDWVQKIDSITALFPHLVSGGITPTGPAIREATEKLQALHNRGEIDGAKGWAEEG
ncbi:MAG TPA: hypothetical protein VK029_07345 [Pseudogracilibacillus sp.]|nr:hypothetical protein [Pseudogracilibacillus sp.]